jgi:trans-2,3-dihydro-3-hydroxyanthranilate isomerase
MESAMRLTIVDVFAERPYEGNQLAVVRDAAGLDTERMQAIAREMNFSETTFVVAESTGRAQVRIFTPGEELPFAGHPTLGTACVLAAGRSDYVLDLPIGPVSVTFRDGVAWLTPPAAEFGSEIPSPIAAELIGVDEADLDLSLTPRTVRCGPLLHIAAVRDLAVLKRVRVDLDVRAGLGFEGYPFVVCRGGYSTDADYAARMMFFDGVSIREDPATGSANAAFAQYLHRLGERGPFIVEQGYEVRRPSRIYLDLANDATSGMPVTVGGRVQPVAEGRLV